MVLPPAPDSHYALMCSDARLLKWVSNAPLTFLLLFLGQVAFQNPLNKNQTVDFRAINTFSPSIFGVDRRHMPKLINKPIPTNRLFRSDERGLLLLFSLRFFCPSRNRAHKRSKTSKGKKLLPKPAPIEKPIEVLWPLVHRIVVLCTRKRRIHITYYSSRQNNNEAK